MNRRAFLKSAAALAAVPLLPAAPAAAATPPPALPPYLVGDAVLVTACRSDPPGQAEGLFAGFVGAVGSADDVVAGYARIRLALFGGDNPDDATPVMTVRDLLEDPNHPYTLVVGGNVGSTGYRVGLLREPILEYFTARRLEYCTYGVADLIGRWAPWDDRPHV